MLQLKNIKFKGVINIKGYSNINSLRELRAELLSLEGVIMTPKEMREKLKKFKILYRGEEPIWVEAFLDDAIEGQIPISFFIERLNDVIFVVDRYKK